MAAVLGVRRLLDDPSAGVGASIGGMSRVEELEHEGEGESGGESDDDGAAEREADRELLPMPSHSDSPAARREPLATVADDEGDEVDGGYEKYEPLTALEAAVESATVGER